MIGCIAYTESRERDRERRGDRNPLRSYFKPAGEERRVRGEVAQSEVSPCFEIELRGGWETTRRLKGEKGATQRKVQRETRESLDRRARRRPFPSSSKNESFIPLHFDIFNCLCLLRGDTFALRAAAFKGRRDGERCENQLFLGRSSFSRLKSVAKRCY